MTNVQKAYEHVYRKPNSKSANFIVGTLWHLGMSGRDFHKEGQVYIGIQFLREDEQDIQKGISERADKFEVMMINDENKTISLSVEDGLIMGSILAQ
jgi:hypothetical protein